jgi:prophage maintenance system killer protein
LDLNGIAVDYPEEMLYKLMMDASSGKITKNEIAEFLRKK